MPEFKPEQWVSFREKDVRFAASKKRIVGQIIREAGILYVKSPVSGRDQKQVAYEVLWRGSEYGIPKMITSTLPESFLLKVEGLVKCG